VDRAGLPLGIAEGRQGQRQNEDQDDVEDLFVHQKTSFEEKIPFQFFIYYFVR
jgi:hypothetical protein